MSRSPSSHPATMRPIGRTNLYLTLILWLLAGYVTNGFSGWPVPSRTKSCRGIVSQQYSTVPPRWNWLGRNTRADVESNETIVQQSLPTLNTTASVVNDTNATELKVIRQTRNPKSAFFDTWDEYIEKERDNNLSSSKQQQQLLLQQHQQQQTDAEKDTDQILITNKAPNETLTVADLEDILRANRFLRETDLAKIQNRVAPNLKNAVKRSNSVAFPQSSVLSYQDLTIGSTVSGSLLGALLGITVYSNLWLLGSIFGGLWSYEVSKNYSTAPPANVFANLVIDMGRRLAHAYLLAYDGANGIWFMYKTGQLSYEYYKTYSKLDERFAITNKVDAWNARFQEGKLVFDKWERENEVGRKLLAGVRTMWLVEEKASKKGRKKIGKDSKYRVVQWYFNVITWLKRFMSSLWNTITGGGSSELKDVLQGIRINISTSALDDVGTKIGAAVAALITVYLVGSCFAIAPMLLGSIAVVTGLVWPTWIPELLTRGREQVNDLRAQGRGEGLAKVNTPKLLSKKKKTNFLSWFRRGPKTRPPLQEQWGIVGGLVAQRNSPSKKKQRKK